MAIKDILVLEPYYGGSHKQFINGLTAAFPHRFTLLTLPPRKWKQRMQLSAPWFAAYVRDLPVGRRSFAAVIATTFTDLAVFKALTVSLPGWNKDCRYLSYFHENQFAYPGRFPGATHYQFAAINFTTALASDGIAFNSAFNRDSFIHQCHHFLEKETDTKVHRELERIQKKSRVLYPGFDFSDIDAEKGGSKRRSEPLIVWNHRWEHDKNPEAFFNALYRLHEAGIVFRYAVLGQRFREVPDCFRQARERLGDRCEHDGYLPDRKMYLQLLTAGDIVVSSALHEFFGMAVIEAVRAGCLPVLPNRLSYPELFDQAYLYQDDGLAEHLCRVLRSGERLTRAQGRLMTERFSWAALNDSYRGWFESW